MNWIIPILEEHGDEGEIFGSTTDDRGCIDEVYRRSLNCGHLCGLKHGMFLSSCIRTAKNNSQVCRGVPSFKQANIDFKRAANRAMWNLPPEIDWVEQKCIELGYPDQQTCFFIMEPLSMACDAQNVKE